MKRSGLIPIFILIVIAVVLIILGIILTVKGEDDSLKSENKPKETEQGQKLEDLIEFDKKDAATSIFVTLEHELININSINLDSSVTEKKVIIRFEVIAKANVTANQTGTLVLKNDEDQIMDTLPFIIPILNEKQTETIELTSNNLKTILSTNVEVIIG